MSKLNQEWREKWNPCKEAWDWLEAQEERDAEKVIRKLVSEKKYEWAFWALARCVSRESAVKLSIFSARLVLPIYEKEFPGDDRARRAIEAAERGEPDCSNAANAAAATANAATANAAYAAAAYATYAAYAAAYADANAAYAAYAAAASNAEKEKTVMKIVEYGFELMRNELEEKHDELR